MTEAHLGDRIGILRQKARTADDRSKPSCAATSLAETRVNMLKLAVICPVAKGCGTEIEFDFPEEAYNRVNAAVDAGEKMKIICAWLCQEGLRCADPDCNVPLEKHYFSFRS